eukprot:CAMPEP_0201867544 /NCGR_PEP_ID=MMETSP0902-20130614/1732_1 /ASSEMBLY_ACC=CAM_ASM_000551 /TAXON_ID=420261 /ORGANISM="Thalassiosira antarctica, Strain CCMP982" /LENGTH=289 /DNA_ID=CAMNT_0048392711 /DNA_START=39 /DNA_END=908 /DNA_ORIENTATION=+
MTAATPNCCTMPALHNIPLFVCLAFSPLLLSSWSVESFSPSRAAVTLTSTRTRTHAAFSAEPPARYRRRDAVGLRSAVLPLPLEEEDNEEMEWVEEEFELLTERDFYNTEWKIGTIMDDKPRDAKSITTTWVRLVTTEAGDNKAIWGDDSQGKWTIDVPSQFFSISKESFGGWFGKQIWAGTIEDFYYLEGTVRGWSPISPASVVGQWQGVRLGVIGEEARVSEDERGVAPWFAVIEEEEEDSVSEDEDGEGIDVVKDEADENGADEKSVDNDADDGNDEESDEEEVQQ